MVKEEGSWIQASQVVVGLGHDVIARESLDGARAGGNTTRPGMLDGPRLLGRRGARERPDRPRRPRATPTILTGLLVGVFVGIVVLATEVLPFSSPVAVAASTLAVAALFNPLRLRVQRLVDRRFNRARYDAEAIVAAFTLRLRDAVDLDTVRSELLLAVDRAVEPAHASVWLRPRH
jgi:hypothetical protein